MSRIIPISELWSKGRWIVFEDIIGDLHDCTGDIVYDGKFLVLDNREDGKRLEIPREFVIWEETI